MSAHKNEWFVLEDATMSPITEEKRKGWLNDAPPWRTYHPNQTLRHHSKSQEEKPYVLPPAAKEKDRSALLYINMALILRRPLLVTGRPGIGKSSLADYLAHRLGLGKRLVWPINSQSTLREGLYSYDAVGHLSSTQHQEKASIGEFITLGPLGTAMLPTEYPRVLLIDEIDKANYDLPNDLLNVLEEGSFVIPEIQRLRKIEHEKAAGAKHSIYASGMTEKIDLIDGHVQTKHYPVVVMTSNGERDFPEAFLRRCISLELGVPEKKDLIKIVYEQLRKTVDEKTIEDVFDRLELKSSDPTDVVLQSIFIGLKGGKKASTQILRRKKG